MSNAKNSASDNLHEASSAFKVMAFYKFADLFDFEAIKPVLAEFCCARSIRGTFILAPEGLNGTVAGRAAAIDELAAFLDTDPLFAGRLSDAEVKFSTASDMPFLRMKVRLKQEIVTLRAPEANPALQVGTYVEPEDWNALLADPDVVLVDTRNDYEYGIGTFEGAIDPKTTAFTEFKDFVAENLDPARNKKVAMFCTGGIRCEKASSYLLSHGFENVFHLKGGILKYLEKVPEDQSRWKGECFVFDERVSVGHGLVEGDATLCRSCRRPLTAEDRAHPDYLENVRCAHCADDADKHARSAERHHQMQLAAKRGMAHIGQDAVATAEANKLAAEERRARSRQSR